MAPGHNTNIYGVIVKFVQNVQFVHVKQKKKYRLSGFRIFTRHYN